MRKLLELSSRPATRLMTRTRKGSTWVISTTSTRLATTSSRIGRVRRQNGGQALV